MDWEDAQKLVEWVELLGTLDFSILSKHIQAIPVQKGGGFPVPPMILVVGVRFILVIIARIMFACKIRQMGLVTSRLTATTGMVVESLPLSTFRKVSQRNRLHKPPHQ